MMSAKVVESSLLFKDTQLKEFDWNEFFSPLPINPSPSGSVLLDAPRITTCNPTTTPETLRTSCPPMTNHVGVLPAYPSQVHAGSGSHRPNHPPLPLSWSSSSPQLHRPSTMMMSAAPGFPQPLVKNVDAFCAPPPAAFSSTTLRPPLPPPRPEIVDKSHPLPSLPHNMLQQHKHQPPQSRSRHPPNWPSHLAGTPPVPFTKHNGDAAMNHVMYDGKPPATSSLPIQSTPSRTLYLGNLPSLPPAGPPPINSIQNQNQHQPPEGQLSGLLGSLMAKGLISLPTQPAEQVVEFQDQALDFNSAALKVRHESTIKALYADLPRQCRTCGLRFKTREEHSSHMDWHVTKNRESKNRKHKASRKWFVSVSNWLRGLQASSGTDQVVSVFSATDPVVEKNQDDESVVPADEDQNACALCREPFDYFFSEETDDWMYKGAVYMNAPNGITAGMDKSQLGPIVHAKCRPDESSVVPTANSARQAQGEGNGPNARKRPRGDDTGGDPCPAKLRHCH